MGTVTGVRNAAIVAAATVVSNGLWPLLVLRLLGALRLLALRLRLALRLLGALRLLALRLRLALRLLGALWLRFLCALLWLGFLCVLRLRLVLRRLGFCSATALFLLAFLCECRNGGSEK
jgi:hypothetical protein